MVRGRRFSNARLAFDRAGRSPSVLFHLLHKNIQSHTKWNPMLSRYEVIKPIDHYTDMTYTETRSMAGGLVSHVPVYRLSV